MSHAETRTFTCSECAASVPLTAATRDALLASGCPVCSSAVSEAALGDP